MGGGGSRRASALLFAALLLAVIPFAVRGSPTAPPAPAEDPQPQPAAPPFSANVRVNFGNSTYRYQVEPTMVINSMGQIFVGWKEAPGASAGGERVSFSTSTDGGMTWSRDVFMQIVTLLYQSDPWLTVTGTDRVYFTRIEYASTSSSGGLAVTNTTDGVTWGTTFYYDDAPNFADKESAAHDAAGNLYWVWNTDSTTGELAFARSNDGGATWTPKVLVNDQPSMTYGETLGGIVQVAPDGTVLATWWNTDRNNIMFDRSSDGGRTWGTDIRVNANPGTARWTAQWVIPLPAMAIAPDGTIYISWTDSAAGNENIVVSHSVDGGSTWSAPVRVNDDPGTARQWMPDVAIDPDGRLHVAWEDDRTGQHNIYYANSTNGGVTFGPNVRVSTVGTPLSYIRPGDYFAIEAAANGTVAVVWTDGRGTDLDIYFASLPAETRHKLDTVPPGLTLELDGIPVTAPYFFPCTPGPPHMINAPSPQIAGSSRYTFASWSDGGVQGHGITCDTKTYTAYFTTEHEVTVTTSPPGLSVTVDGFTGPAPQTYWWAEGSSHPVFATSPQTQGQTRYVFVSWSDGGGQGHAVSAAAPATYVASFGTQYAVTVDTSPPNLNVTVDGVPRVAPQTDWWDAGSLHVLDAPSPQTAAGTQRTFTIWSDAGLQNHTVVALGPATYTAIFGVQYEITLLTQPNGFPLVVDGTSTFAPYRFWCGAGTNHTIEAPTPDLGPQTLVTFLWWSDGGNQNHTITCTAPATYTASFRVEDEIRVDTAPTGLQVTVGGVPATAPYAFYCERGTAATIGVPSPQGSGGVRYAFTAWSDRGAQNHSVGCFAPASYTASFWTEFQVTLATSPPGLQILLTGTAVTAPQTYWWAANSTHPLDVATPQGSGSTRSVFLSWSDGGARAHTATAVAPATITATFQVQYLLTVASPRGSAACGVADCWYNASAIATFSVTPSTIAGPVGTRYVFARWSGDSTATTANATVAMTTPRTVTAVWRTEHLLTIVSAYGSPQGAGWIAENATANVTVEETVEVNGAMYRFAGWTGDATSTIRALGVLMDGPKTIHATWETSFGGPPYVGFPSWALIPLVLAVALLLIAFFLWRRRKRGEPDEAPVPPKT